MKGLLLIYGKFLKHYLAQNKWPINVSEKGKGREGGNDGGKGKLTALGKKRVKFP